jgi:hypothetical protein
MSDITLACNPMLITYHLRCALKQTKPSFWWEQRARVPLASAEHNNFARAQQQERLDVVAVLICFDDIIL